MFKESNKLSITILSTSASQMSTERVFGTLKIVYFNKNNRFSA